MAIILNESSSLLLAKILLPKAVIVQNKNRIVNELHKADIIFIATAT